MKRYLVAVVLVTITCILPGTVSSEVATRPSVWALPITAVGAPNLHKVSDTLYRSAQPEKNGIPNLKALGIKTVVNLRAYHTDDDVLSLSGLYGAHCPMTAWNPDIDSVAAALKIMTDPSKTPVLVHCLHGADRTGIVIAAYRITVQGWSKDDAIREMTDGGFGFHSVWVHLPDWVRTLDVDMLKAKAGIL